MSAADGPERDERLFAEPGEYDEFGLFLENAEEAGLAWLGPPVVHRRFVTVGPGRRISALCWGSGEPELVLVHGGAQNAHTWDTLALALDRPLVAVDLPGHGHSDWWDEPYHPVAMADAVAVAVAELAPQASVVVGMSLGGLTALALASTHHHLVRRLALVDITPGVNRDKARSIIEFTSGPERFESFAAILERTVTYNPTRSVRSLRRGVLHNAVRDPDGGWTWRYDRRPRAATGEGRGPVAIAAEPSDPGALWDHVDALRAPLLLVKGGRSPVVDDEDLAELRRRRPAAEVVVVADAGHSVQGDQPLELAALLERFLGG